MKPNLEIFQIFKFAGFASIALALSTLAMADTNISGNAIISGNNLWLGSTGANIEYSPSSADSTLGSVYYDIQRTNGRYLWRDNASAWSKMLLNSDNSLTLYKSSAAASPGISLHPDTGRIDLKGTVDGGIYSGATPILKLSTTTGANMTVSNLSVAGDSFINGVRIGKGLGGIASNTTLGINALDSNTSGVDNAASGASALTANTAGGRNTAHGSGALLKNTLGSGNSAVGAGALYYNIGAASPSTAGSNNTAIGDSAGTWFGATGTGKLNAASYSIYIGAGARGASANDLNSIVIGATAVSKGSNTTVIGTPATLETHLAGRTITNALNVSGQATAGALNVTGQAGAGSLNITGQTATNSLTVAGNTVLTGATVLNGQVTLTAPQGDISMGIYE